MNAAAPLRLVVIAGHDAYLKCARNICGLMAQQGPVEVQWFTTSPQLVSAEVQWLDMEHLSDDRNHLHYSWLQRAQQIIAGLGGRDLNRLIRAVHGAKHKTAIRPLIVGYFPGILHLRIFESLATRLCCDRVLLNCARDYRLYHQLALTTRGHNNGLLLGAPWIGAPPVHDQPTDIDLLFVEQSIVPCSLADRTQLVAQLISLARQHPDWRIVIALRARKGEASSHQPEHCLEAIWQTLDDGSVRLEFVYDDIDLLLRRSKRLATISSSVAFTSLAWGKPTLFINDLGVRQRWGNDQFALSGYMAPLLAASQQTFSLNRWSQQFIQAPSAEIITRLYQATTADAGSAAGAEPSGVSAGCCVSGIPGIHALNLRLIWLVVRFYQQNLKSSLSEFSGLCRSIRNINRHIYNSAAGQ